MGTPGLGFTPAMARAYSSFPRYHWGRMYCTRISSNPAASNPALALSVDACEIPVLFIGIASVPPSRAGSLGVRPLAHASARMEPSLTTTTSNGSQIRRRAAALLEVAGVFVAGNTAASWLGQWLGVRSLGPMLESALKAPEPDLVPLTWALLQALGVQYGCLLPLAFGIGWWHRRRTLSRCGLTTAGHSLPGLVAIGLLGFCLVALPFKVLWIVQQHVSLGAGSFWWTLFARSWTPSFWLFFAVGSFVLVPVIEELFFRGYCQSRLEEDFGGSSAMVIAALFFVFTHGQYHQASILSAATMLCMVPMALGIGYVYLRTRSLVPCIALHAALNFPTKGTYDIVLPVVMILGLVAFRRHWLRAVRDFGRRMPGIDALATLVGVFCAVAVAAGFQRWPGVFVPLASGGLAVALFMEYRERLLARTIVPLEPEEMVT